MTVRDFLMSTRNANLELKRCERRLRELRDRATSITSSLGAEPVCSSGDPHKDSLLIAIADHEAKVKQLRRAALSRILATESFIDELEDPLDKIVLSLRYCDDRSWDDVALQLESFGVYRSRAEVFRLHKAALDAARQMWEVHHERFENDQFEEKC